jgi:cytochrome c-type biogenesis protein CcmE
MKKNRLRRLYGVLFIIFSSALAFGLVYLAIKDNVNLFYSPTDLFEDPPKGNNAIRAGGLVELGTLKRAKDSLKVDFKITDLKNSIMVTYKGILPVLFKENAGVVATGYFDKESMSLQAYQILAKHDENYVPKEVKKALDR